MLESNRPYSYAVKRVRFYLTMYNWSGFTQLFYTDNDFNDLSFLQSNHNVDCREYKIYTGSLYIAALLVICLRTLQIWTAGSPSTYTRLSGKENVFVW